MSTGYSVCEFSFFSRISRPTSISSFGVFDSAMHAKDMKDMPCCFFVVLLGLRLELTASQRPAAWTLRETAAMTGEPSLQRRVPLCHHVLFIVGVGVGVGIVVVAVVAVVVVVAVVIVVLTLTCIVKSPRSQDGLKRLRHGGIPRRKNKKTNQSW